MASFKLNGELKTADSNGTFASEYTVTSTTAKVTDFAFDSNSTGATAEVSPSGTVNIPTTTGQQFTITVKAQNGSTTQTVTFPVKRKTYPVTFSVVGGHGQIKAGSGSFVPNGSTQVEHGESVTFTAQPDTGWEVDGWTVDSSAVSANTSYTLNNVTAAKNVTVRFKKKTYTVTFSVVGGHGQIKAGSGSFVPNGSTQVEHGGSVTFTAQPDTGWEVDGWTVDSSAVSANTSYTLNNVTAAKNVTVRFKKKTYTVTFSVVGGHGQIKAGSGGFVSNGNIQVPHGGSVTFTAQPDNGWEVDRWTVNGSAVSANTNYTLSNVTAAKTVTVKFKKKTYRVTFSVQDGRGGSLKGVYNGSHQTASGSNSPSFTVPYGESVTFTATPDNGWKVDRWTVSSGNSTSGGNAGATNYTLSNITGEKTVRVKFKPGEFNLMGGNDAWKKLKEEAAKTSGAHTILINGEIKATGGDDAGQIKLGRDLIIKGKNSAVLNANSKSRIFKVESGKTLTLEDITLKNGYAGGDNGGGVYVNAGGTLIMKDSSTITGCSAGKGDGVYVYGTFKMQGGAKVDKNNEVYLETDKTITVTGALTHKPAAKIKLADYKPNRVLATGAAAEKENFTLARDGNNNAWRYKKKAGGVQLVRGKLTVRIDKIISIREDDGLNDAEYYWTMTVDGENISVLNRDNAWKPEKQGKEYTINKSKDISVDLDEFKTVEIKFLIKEKDHSGDDIVADTTKNCTYIVGNDKWQFEGRNIECQSEDGFRLEFRSGDGDVDVICYIRWQDE